MVATEAWRKDANAAFDLLPHGAKKACAVAVGCSGPTVTQLLQGKIDSSQFVGPISVYLGIPKPLQVMLEPDEHEVLSLYRSASERDRRMFHEMMQRLLVK